MLAGSLYLVYQTVRGSAPSIARALCGSAVPSSPSYVYKGISVVRSLSKGVLYCMYVRSVYKGVFLLYPVSPPGAARHGRGCGFQKASPCFSERSGELFCATRRALRIRDRRQVGPSAFIAIAVMVLMAPLNAYIARQFMRYQRDINAARDGRVKLTTELLQGSKLIKMLGCARGVGVLQSSQLKRVSVRTLRAIKGKFIASGPVNTS